MAAKVDTQTIQNIFFEQVKNLSLETTKKSCLNLVYWGEKMNKELRENKRLKRLLRQINHKDDDIYTDNGVNNYLNDDSITAAEQGFMLGYLGT